LTEFIALVERCYGEPLAFQRQFAARLSHFAVPPGHLPPSLTASQSVLICSPICSAFLSH